MISSRLRTAQAIVAFTLLLVVVYADPLFTRRNFVGRDLLAYNLPMEKTVHDAYARGSLPVWSAEISGGRPLLANPNAGALYPVRWLLAPFPFPVAMRLFPFLHWLAGGIGVLLFLRRAGTSIPAAWVGATTYSFSGVAVSPVFSPHLLPGVALLPWLLWAAAEGKPARRESRVLWLAALFGLDFLAAEVFTILVGIAGVFLWILVESVPGDRWPRVRELLIGLSLAALLAAPQIVASALWAGEIRRAGTGFSIGEVILYSLSPARLLELIIPYPFGPTWKIEPSAAWAPAIFRGRPMGLFLTIYTGSLAVMAVPALARSKAPGARFAKALLGAGLAATVLPALLPEAWSHLPSPLPLRSPEKLAVSIALALSILAALAFDRFRAAASPPRIALVVGALLFAAAVAARLAAGTAALPQALAEGALLWMLTVAALELARRGGAARTAMALLLLTLVPIAATRRIPETAAEGDAFAPPPFARIQRKRDPSGLYRTLGEAIYRAAPVGVREQGSGWLPSSAWTWTEYTQALWGRGTVFNTDFDSGDLFPMESLRRLSSYAARFRDAGPFFGTLALKWGVRFRGQEPIAGYRPIGGDRFCEWDEHERAFPGIRLLEGWKEEPGPVEAMGAIPRLAAGEIVLETGRRSAGRARAGTVRLLEQTPERLTLETSAPEPGWLFVLREFWVWRRVRVDGKDTLVVPAQLAFSAIAVPAGAHRVEWVEQVPGGKISRWGPVLFLLLFTGLFVRKSRRGRR